MRRKIADEQQQFAQFKKEYGSHSLGNVTISQAIGGMRGITGMLYETSKLHPLNGITYRGHDLFEIIDKCPSAKDGNEPLPEAVLWLLLTSEVPTE